MKRTVVETIDLKKTYMLGKIPVEALLGVNLKVESGDFLAILRSLRQRKINHAKLDRRLRQADCRDIAD